MAWEEMDWKLLLGDVVDRAIHDWVIYRGHSRIDKRRLAADAYSWLFLEKPGNLIYERNKAAGFEILTFLGVCSALGWDPEQVRNRARTHRAQDLLYKGRPKQTRKLPSNRC